MNIQTFLVNILAFINKTVVPVLMAVALLCFLWNIVRYFIIGGSNEESQVKAKSLAIWGITAFVIITALWGIVNVFISTLGLTTHTITPDYMCGKLDC